jgi:hypothetical protein
MRAGRAEGVFVGQYFGWSDGSGKRLDGFVVSLGEHEAVLELEAESRGSISNCAGFEPKVGTLLVSSSKPSSFAACR